MNLFTKIPFSTCEQKYFHRALLIFIGAWWWSTITSKIKINCKGLLVSINMDFPLIGDGKKQKLNLLAVENAAKATQPKKADCGPDLTAKPPPVRQPADTPFQISDLARNYNQEKNMQTLIVS